MLAGTSPVNIRWSRLATASGDPIWRNRSASGGGVGYPAKTPRRSHLRDRQRHKRDLGDEEGRDQQRRKPELTSDQGNDFSLRVVIALDVSSRCPEARMSGQLLDVSEAPANLSNFSGGTGDEGPATAVA